MTIAERKKHSNQTMCANRRRRHENRELWPETIEMVEILFEANDDGGQKNQRKQRAHKSHISNDSDCDSMFPAKQSYLSEN